MSEKKSKTTKKAAAKKTESGPETKTAKAPREKKPKEDLVVFAIRLTAPERKAIHYAAGPRNATQFVRAVALAAARDDDAAFQQAIADARALRV